MKQEIDCGAFVLDLSALDQPGQPQPSWRERYRVHPSAAVFPMMGDVELETLGQDIKANGQQQVVVLCRIAGTTYLLDGRNRLEAMYRLGLDRQVKTTTIELQDPAAFVISANIRRRHLTKEQQAELIVKAIAAGKQPIANMAIGPGRRDAKGRNVKDPNRAQAITEAAKLGISPRTVDRARVKVNGRTYTPKPAKKKIGLSKQRPKSTAVPLGTSRQAIAKSNGKMSSAPRPQWEDDLRSIIHTARQSASVETIRQFVLALLKDAR